MRTRTGSALLIALNVLPPLFMLACGRGDLVVARKDGVSAGGAPGVGGSGASAGYPHGGGPCDPMLDPAGNCIPQPLPPGSPCRPWEDYCLDDHVCLPLDCGGVEGICDAPAADCVDDYDPVCGCSGVTYWNSCRLGQAMDTPRSFGPCVTEAIPCGEFPDAPCGGGLVCLHLDAATCQAGGPGRCWDLPLGPETPPGFSSCAGESCLPAEALLADPQPGFYVDPGCL